MCLFAFTNLVFLTIFADGHIDVPLVFQVKAVTYFSDSAHLSTRCEVTFTPLNVMNVCVCTCISKLCNTEVSLNDVEGTVACSNMQGYQHYCALYSYCSLFLVYKVVGFFFHLELRFCNIL